MVLVAEILCALPRGASENISNSPNDRSETETAHRGLLFETPTASILSDVVGGRGTTNSKNTAMEVDKSQDDVISTTS